MGRRKRLCIISTDSDEENELMETQGQVDPQSGLPNIHEEEGESSDQQSSQPTLQQDLLDEAAQDTRKKVRGPTQKAETWKMRRSQKIAVTFNKFGKPVGDEGNELTQYLGTLVRMAELVEIGYSDWRKVPMHKKEDMYTMLKAKFIIRPTETSAIKKWIFHNIGKKWRTWKNNLKARAYDTSLTIEEIVAKETENDNRLNPEQFKELVARGFTPEYQRTCAVRRVSRSKMQEPHVTGTKSFARLAHEEAMKNNGVPLTRGETYIKTRTHKDGSIVDDKAAQVVASLQDIASGSTNVQGMEDDYSNDDYSKVKGPEKQGYIRLIGRMPAVKENVASSFTSPQTVQKLQDEVANQRNVINIMFNLFQQHIPNANLSGALSNLNIQIPHMTSSVPNNSPSMNQSSSSGYHNNSGS